MKRLVRLALEESYGAATAWKKTAVVSGITLPIDGLSARMRFQMLIGYETPEVELAKTHLKPDDCVLEVGASIGFMALFCIKNIGVKNYAMVEANPHMKDRIQSAFEMNEVPIPPVFECAIGGEDGVVDFGINRHAFSSSTLSRDHEVERIKAKQRSLPSLLGELNFTPNVLLMDIEGGETDIPPEHFAGFSKVIIELHPRLVGADKIAALVDGLEHAGFRETSKKGNVSLFEMP